MSKFLPNLRSITSKVAGFTMIELLIVITILGILATAVLSAINPIEQINRGRDTASQSDAEQLINAIERYNAFQEYYPWTTSQNADFTIGTLTTIGSDWDDGTCEVLEKLSSSANSSCTGTNELKSSFTSRISGPTARRMFVFNGGNTGDSTYVCFIPQSQAMKTKAKDRCGGDTGPGLPTDVPTGIASTLCTPGNEYVCLP